MEEVDRLARQPNTVVISCEMELNLEGLKTAIWEVRQDANLERQQLTHSTRRKSA